MRNLKYIVTVILILLFFLNSGMVQAESPELPTQPISQEDRDRISDNLNISLLETEPEKRPFDCFDVNSNQDLAIGRNNLDDIIVAVYNDSGLFEYGYRLSGQSAFGVKWEGDILIIYIVRSDLVVYVDPSGKIVDIVMYEYTPEGGAYWRNYIDAKQKTIDGTTYTAKNNIGPLALFAMSYSKVTATDDDGTLRTVYDASGVHLLQILLSTAGVLLFMGFVAVSIVKLFQERRKRHDD